MHSGRPLAIKCLMISLPAFAQTTSFETHRAVFQPLSPHVRRRAERGRVSPIPLSCGINRGGMRFTLRLVFLTTVCVLLVAQDKQPTRTPARAASQGTLVLNSVFEGTIEIDGKEVAKTSSEQIQGFKLSPGEHFVTLKAVNGMKLDQKTVTIGRGTSTTETIGRVWSEKPVPSDVSVGQNEIASIVRSGRYAPLPINQKLGEGSGSGPSHLSILNHTPYALTLTFSGSTTKSVTVNAGQAFKVDIPPGVYMVLGRVDNDHVLPFFGHQEYSAGADYQSTFTIGR